MRKIFLSVFMVMVLFLLQGCAIDRYVGKRPSDQDNTKWVSEEPDIYFEVSDKYADITGCNTYGKIVMEGIETEIAVSFAAGSTRVKFRPVSSYHKEDNEENSYIDGDDWLFLGKCRFSNDKLVVTVSNNEKGFLDESIEKITFIKEKVDIDN